MRLFISWSGEVALKAASLLERALPEILPFVTDIWHSPQIEAGKIGAAAILESIARADAGVVILTPQSQHSPWVLFESGAFAYRDRFVPLLLGLAPDELAQPYPHFQARPGTRSGFLQAISDLWKIAQRSNSGGDASLDEVLARAESEWPALRVSLEPLFDAGRQMTRELQFGFAARYITQAEREASSQRHRADHHEARADAFRSLVQFFLKYEQALSDIDPRRFVQDMQRDMPVIRQIVETENFGTIEEGTPWVRAYKMDD